MIFTVLIIILYYQYYDTEDFSSISIIVMLNITIHGNIAQPYPVLSTLIGDPSVTVLFLFHRLILLFLISWMLFVFIGLFRKPVVLLVPLVLMLHPGTVYMYLFSEGFL